MGDFLSNFENENYKKERKQSDKKAERKIKTPEQEIDKVEIEPKPEPKDRMEEFEFDPTYRIRKMKKLILAVAAGVVVVVLGCFGYYQMTHIKMPDFQNKSISDVSDWAEENGMKTETVKEYSLKQEVNKILNQSVKKGKKVKKGSRIKFTVSIGADPDEVIGLPNFEPMSQDKAKAWVEDHKMENLKIILEYSDQVEKGKYIRQEISDKEITAEAFRRKDRGIVYFSKGAEVFEKNIAMPDFANKAKSDVESWAKTNQIEVTYEEVPSKEILLDKVVSQSVAKDEKIAKHEKITIQISLGKPATVPDFGKLDATQAAIIKDINVEVSEVFSSSVSYGKLISQSVPAGTELTDKDDKNVKVVYSCGSPYLRSYIGQLEGDLPKLFFTDYVSKNANIRYKIYYVDSEKEKGRVVEMSTYNEYVGMNYTVSIGISLGNLTPVANDPVADEPTPPSPEPGAEGDEFNNTEPVE